MTEAKYDGDLHAHVRRVLLYASQYGDSVCICENLPQHDDECLDTQRLWQRVAAPLPDAVAELRTFADGYCEQCSELSYALTRALEKTGVPTGETDWQRNYGPNKVRELDDYKDCLRRLLNAMEDPESKQEDITQTRERAEFYFEFHRRVRQALTAKAQAIASELEKEM